MTCVNINKTTTTNGTPSSHSSSGIVRLHFPKHWNGNVSALPMFHWIDRTASLSSDPTGGALSAKRRRPQSGRTQRLRLWANELSQHYV
jgi:hypothetical protein